jgi:6-pyruvoyl-tetrahydropterin synthase
MGSGTFDPNKYRAFTASTVGRSTDQIYSGREMHKDLNPLGVAVRESRDSADNPKSTPIIVGLDVTGSMGMIADKIAREGLGVLFNGILDRKPVTDPHVMFMGIGDANSDRAPLQVSQFEADNRIVEQLTKLWLEHGGGGNQFESYNLPWYFAAMHTAHDSIEKRAKRGYLFTVGDENAPQDLTDEQIKRFIGDTVERHLTTREVLELAQRKYDVFHVIIEQGDHARHYGAGRVVATWAPLLGQRVIRLSDYTKLAETIVSAIEVAEGRDAATSAAGWGASSATVMSAVRHLTAARPVGLLGGPAT